MGKAEAPGDPGSYIKLLALPANYHSVPAIADPRHCVRCRSAGTHRQSVNCGHFRNPGGKNRRGRGLNRFAGDRENEAPLS